MTVVVIVALSVAAAGCSSRIEDPGTPDHQPVARPSGVALDTEQRAAVDTAWAAYLKLNAIYVDATRTGSYDWDEDTTKRPLYEYAAGHFLAALERDLDLMQEHGILRTGEPTVTLRRVVSVSPTSIIVESCVDNSGTDTVDSTTKKSVAAPEQNKKYPVTLRAGLYPDGLWRWVESHADRGSSC